MIEQAIEEKSLYEISSGMGGAFTVRIVDSLHDGRVKVKVHMPRNPDWHGVERTVSRSALRPLR